MACYESSIYILQIVVPILYLANQIIIILLHHTHYWYITIRFMHVLIRKLQGTYILLPHLIKICTLQLIGQKRNATCQVRTYAWRNSESESEGVLKTSSQRVLIHPVVLMAIFSVTGIATSHSSRCVVVIFISA